MKKLAFITNEYHMKSSATRYVVDVLKNRFKVKRFSTETWQGAESTIIEEVNRNDYDIVMFLQNYPTPKTLKRLKQKNIIWCPMFDTEMRHKEKRYLNIYFFSLKILSFSEALLKRIRDYGFDTQYSQLYIKPLKRINKDNKRIKVFYWPRLEIIGWKTVKRLLGQNFDGEVIIQNIPDPKNTFKMPSKEDIEKYNIKFITEWLPFEEILKIRASADLFIAPRSYEGIGLTFLEAMAAGVAVVSPDNSTMNEYIEDGVNGYLYNLDEDIEPLDLSNLEVVKDNAYQSIKVGYKEWQIKQKDMLDFCERSIKKQRKKITVTIKAIVFRIASRLVKIIRNK